MTSKTITITQADIQKHVSIEVVVDYEKGVKFRLWLAMLLIHIAAWVAGMSGVNVREAQ